MQYITKANTTYAGKPKVYICAHPEDIECHTPDIAKDIFRTQNCSIWYCDDHDARGTDEHLAELSQMQLFVLPVTTRLLTTRNIAIERELPFALKNNIPVLPLMQEVGLDTEFNRILGDLQFLDKHNVDPSTISYHEKLSKYLSAILIDDKLAQKVREAFDAYVFLSYRKKDRMAAQSLMRLIHRNDFARDIAIWYDEFLVPGENFNHYIEQKLRSSDMFVLAVTPSVLEKRTDEHGCLRDNYIVENEYRIAKESNKIIIPVELTKTDKKALRDTYIGLPDCVSPNDASFSKLILDALLSLAKKRTDASPEHNYFIGLAYLSGIDVEVDYEKAVELISSAAEAGLIEAIDRLINMYSCGLAVRQSDDLVVYWLERKASILETRVVDATDESSVVSLASTNQSLGEYLSKSTKKEDIVRAGALYRKALSLWEQLDTGNKESLSEKIEATSKLYRLTAIWLENNNQLKAALEMYQLLLQQRRQIAIDNPDDLQAKQNLCLVLCDLGILHHKLHQGTKAINHLQEAIDISEPFVEAFDNFAILYGSASNRMATVMDVEGDPQHAMLYNLNACEIYRHLCKKNKPMYELRLAEALLNNGILRSSIDVRNDPEAKEQYLEAIKIYEASSNRDSHIIFCKMVAYYKLANVYGREGNCKAAISAYEQCVAIGEALENLPPTEEVLSQLAVIHLDYGTLSYALNVYPENPETVIEIMEKAVALYEVLCDMNSTYRSLLKEAKEKLASMQHTGNTSSQVDSPPNLETLELLFLIEKGEQLEEKDRYGQALDYYFKALQKLDVLIESNDSHVQYRLTHIDLCERIGDILKNCGDNKEAIEFYELAYTTALVLFKADHSESVICTIASICEKLGSMMSDISDAMRYYNNAYKARKVAVALSQTEENLHRLASTIKTLATLDASRLDTELLSEAQAIWETLFKETLDERYFLLYIAVNRMLEGD